jgi:hypothetical protein
VAAAHERAERAVAASVAQAGDKQDQST